MAVANRAKATLRSESVLQLTKVKSPAARKRPPIHVPQASRKGARGNRVPRGSKPDIPDIGYGLIYGIAESLPAPRGSNTQRMLAIGVVTVAHRASPVPTCT